MKYLYLLLLVLIVYYALKNIYSNYSNSEHFDPSLVPVSSIITLAKVAQKLVDGNGTLTNPGNLQIGVPSAPGNLKVTGTTELSGVSTTITGVTRINGGTSIYGTLGTTGDTAIGGNTTIEGNTTAAGYLTANGANAPRVDFTGSGGGQHMYSYIQTPTLHMGRGWNNGDIIQSSAEAGLALTSDKGVGVIGQFGVTGNVNIGGGLTVGHTKGGTVVTDNIKALTYFDSDNKPRLQFFGGDGHNYYTLGKVDPNPAKPDDPRAFGTKHVFRGPEGNDNACEVEMKGNASVAGKLCIGNMCLSEASLRLLFPSVMIVYATSQFTDLLDWARNVVDDIYPVLFWDGYIHTRHNGTGYLCRSGHEKTNANTYVGDMNANPVFSWAEWNGNNMNDMMDAVVVYPGYGVRIWSNFGAVNDNGSSTPYVFENRTGNVIMSDLTIAKVGGIGFNNNMSSFSTYKL